jgi:acyl-CoA thioester hydrolase
MELSEYKHSIDIHIRYDDLDTFNHVNNKAYLAYLEEARIDFHQKVYKWTGQPKISFLVARIEIDYIRPVVFGDRLKVHSRVSEIGNKSFAISSVFTVAGKKPDETRIVSNAKVVLVNMDLKSGLSIPMSDYDRNLLSEYQGGDRN